MLARVRALGAVSSFGRFVGCFNIDEIIASRIYVMLQLYVAHSPGVHALLLPTVVKTDMPSAVISIYASTYSQSPWDM